LPETDWPFETRTREERHRDWVLLPVLPGGALDFHLIKRMPSICPPKWHGD
jgi:hypothetical protein